MNYLRVAILVAAVCMPVSVSAGELVLSFKNGAVTLKATEVSLRQILNEWARLGQTRIVGLEKLTGAPVTLELIDVPEKQALEILLRSVAGYVAAPRAMASAGLSRFDRLAVLPTSIASAAPIGAAPRPAAFAPTPPTPFPDPIQLANEEPDASEGPTPAGIPVFNPNGEPVNMPGPAVNPGGPMPGQLRPPGTEDPTNPAQGNAPAPVGIPPMITTRPGVIPLPPPAPRP